jgi:hypothetical protein
VVRFAVQQQVLSHVVLSLHNHPKKSESQHRMRGTSKVGVEGVQ